MKERIIKAFNYWIDLEAITAVSDIDVSPVDMGIGYIMTVKIMSPTLPLHGQFIENELKIQKYLPYWEMKEGKENSETYKNFKIEYDDFINKWKEYRNEST